MKVSDLATGLGLMALGAGVALYGLGLPPMPGQTYGAGLFPIALGIGFLGFGAVLARQGWRERQASRMPLLQLADWARDGRLVANMLAVLALTVAYVTLSERVGFILLSIAILMTLFWRFRVNWRRGALVAVLTTAAIQLGFGHFLRVPLPKGLMGGLLDRIFW